MTAAHLHRATRFLCDHEIAASPDLIYDMAEVLADVAAEALDEERATIDSDDRINMERRVG